MLRVKLVCTIGPASRDPAVLLEIVQAGMDVARLNFSYGTHEYHSDSIDLIRAASEKAQRPVAILADLQGPKLRTGRMQEGGVPLSAGDTLVLTVEEIVGAPGRVPIQYKELPQTVNAGERIMLDDGLLELEVLDHTDTEITTRVVVGGLLQSNKGMNLPDASLDIPALTDKDRADVKFALGRQVDWVALSFVRTAHEVYELKSLIQQDSSFGRVTPVIAKIEKPEAVKNIDAILAATDGIMVARGDLGIETAPELVPMAQKMIIAKSMAASKPVITATQMLDSMIRNPRPTRAEASDVANAVLDGTDALMLSGETAAGAYPVDAVRTMVKIALEAERVRESQNFNLKYPEPAIFTSAGAICRAAVYTANDTGARAIIAPSISGATARLMSAFRPHVPLIAVTPSPMVQRQLCLYWGTYPIVTRRLSHMDEVVTDAIDAAQRHGYVQPGDTVVLTAGMAGNVRNSTNLMMVRTIERVLARGTGLGQREVAGRVRRLSPSLKEDSLAVGPQDIIYADSVDRGCLPLLQRAGGLITREPGLDSIGAVAAIEYGIPTVIGAEGNLDAIVDGASVILDATTGVVTEWKK